MSRHDEFMSTVDASRHLGVTTRQIQRLVASGDIVEIGALGKTKMLDARSVQRLKIHKAGRGRPWSIESIDVALELLTDGTATSGTATERTRMRKRLSSITAAELVQATRRRARVRRYRASESFLNQIARDVTLTGTAVLATDVELGHVFGLAGSSDKSLDGYVTEKAARNLITSLRLVEDAGGNVILRVTDMETLLTGQYRSLVVALDLAESLDTRQREAGLHYIAKRLEAFR